MTAAEPWERPCSTCDGSGRVISAAWLAWHAEYGRLERLTDVRARLTALAEHVRRTPREPEDALCAECGGEGVVVTDLGLALLDFLDRRFGVRPRTPKAESRSLRPPPAIEPPSEAGPHGASGSTWAGPAEQAVFFPQAIAGSPVRAISASMPVPTQSDAASALGGQVDETGSISEISRNHLPVAATLAVSPPVDPTFESAAAPTRDGLRPPPDLAGLPSVPPIPLDRARPPGIPATHDAQVPPQALAPPSLDSGPQFGARPQWRSDDTDH